MIHKQEINLHLPVPPSVNSLYVNRSGRGRVTSPAYRRWKHTAGKMLLLQNTRPVLTPATLLIEIDQPRNRDGSIRRGRRDPSNRIKPVEDLLVAHGIIPDDSSEHISSVTARYVNNWRYDRPYAHIRLMYHPVS